MSKFRKKKKKLNVCGKAPVSLMWRPIFELANCTGFYQSGLSETTSDFLDMVGQLKNGARGEDDNKKWFFSITKDANVSMNFVDTPSSIGLVFSAGAIRIAVRELIKKQLDDRYAGHYRGDYRKRESKSKDWVKPDFKGFRYYMKVLDILNFVNESPCDIVECSGDSKVFRAFLRSGYYSRKGVLDDCYLSSRFEATSWYNISQRCYYNDFDETLWDSVGDDYHKIRDNGISFDVILSELSMTGN